MTYENFPPSDITRRTVPIVRVRRIARRLLQENRELSVEVAHLRETVDRYGIEDALRRTIALEDLAAEHAVQEARLRDLLDRVRDTQGLLDELRDVRSESSLH